MSNVQALRASLRQDEVTALSSYAQFRLEKIAYAIERFKQGNVHNSANMHNFIKTIRYPLTHKNDQLHDIVWKLISNEEVGRLERFTTVGLVKSGIEALKKQAYWPFLPYDLTKVGGEAIQKAILKKVEQVLPAIEGGWETLRINKNELARCTELLPFIYQKHVIVATLQEIVVKKQLYPNMTQSHFAEKVALATKLVNELRYRVKEGEFTFDEIYTSEQSLVRLLQLINNAVSKLAP